MHGTDRTLAAVPTRHGPQCNYGRYSAFVPQLSQSPSSFHTRAQTPFYPRTPACYDAYIPHQLTHTGRRGCMLMHAHRHLPCTQRPHTRCLPCTRSLTHSSCLPHTHHTTHTRGGTHPRCFTHTPCLTPTRLFAHACRFWRTRASTHTWCSIQTRSAGKHALRHTRDHTTHTRGLFHTRGLTHTQGLIHKKGAHPYTRALSHTPLHSRYACVAARI